ATALAITILVVIGRLERFVLPQRRPMEITLTLTTEAAFHDVEQRAREFLRDGRVLKVSYTGAQHQILIVARPLDGRHHLSEIAGKLRAMDGVQGVEVIR
ncbi:MAG: hypothetical protein J2P15_13760, partial [Micromonosporaceae bacterium]|nr:hypothetical protein [Micromonosporaceae bacterium]